MHERPFRLDRRQLPDDFRRFCEHLSKLFRNRESPIEPIFGTERIKAALDAPRDGAGPLEYLPEELLDEWAALLGEEIDRAVHYLPLVYQASYARPLRQSVNHLVRSSDSTLDTYGTAESLVGAVSQHLPGCEVRQPLRQFLAIVSNLYRSFLAPDKRISAEMPLAVPTLPPLASFHPGGMPSPYGPAVFTTPMMRLLCGSEVAVVVLPASYHRTPLAWVPLAHEASGHGVLQADPRLLPDLIDGIRTLFGGGTLLPGHTPDEHQALGLLWSYWAEETASDVYGLLNVGPAFALNLAAFLAAQRAVSLNVPAGMLPLLDVESGTDPRRDLGVHPIDVLRLHVAIGVIQNLTDLSTTTARSYENALRTIADLCAQNAWKRLSKPRKIVVRGRVEVDRERWVPLDLELDYKRAAESARRVGAFIASTRLGAFSNRTVQDIETWDDSDELVAGSIARALLAPERVRLVEAGEERFITLSEALKELETSKARQDEIVEALRADRFEELTDDERTVLRLERLKGEVLDNLRAERIEALPDDVAAAVDLGRVDAMGDDGQLIAGATLATLSQPTPDAWRWINRRLAYALNRSHRHDAIMGFASVHGMFDDTVGQPSARTVDPVRGIPPVTTSLPGREQSRDALDEASNGKPSSRSRAGTKTKRR